MKGKPPTKKKRTRHPAQTISGTMSVSWAEIERPQGRHQESLVDRLRTRPIQGRRIA